MKIITGPQKRYTPPAMSVRPTSAPRARTLRAGRRRAGGGGGVGA